MLEAKKHELKAEEERLNLDLKISQSVARSKAYADILGGDLDNVDDRSPLNVIRAKHIDTQSDKLEQGVTGVESNDVLNTTHDSTGDVSGHTSGVHVNPDVPCHMVDTENGQNGVSQNVDGKLSTNVNELTGISAEQKTELPVNTVSHVYANTVIDNRSTSSTSSVHTIAHDFTFPAAQSFTARQHVRPAAVRTTRYNKPSHPPDNVVHSPSTVTGRIEAVSMPQTASKASVRMEPSTSHPVNVESRLNSDAPAFQPPVYKEPYNATSVRDLVTAVSLPQPDVPKYSGNPVEYHAFIMAFDSRIASRTASDMDRLYYLNQYLIDDAKDAISGCLHMNPTVGYAEARRILDREFGDTYKISSAYLNQIMSWGTIKHDNPNSLRKFAVFLRKCHYAMQGITDLTILNYLPNLQMIVTKLPNYLQGKWRDQANRIKMQEGRSPTFLDLTQFVESASETANDPVFGKTALDKLTPNKPQTKVSKPTVSKQGFAVSVNQTSSAKASEVCSNNKSRCLLCDKPHHLDDCFKFRKKTLEERREFIKSKNACFACLEPNHRSKGCLNRITCKECNKRHPTSLHMENFQPSNPQASRLQTGSKSAPQSSGSATGCDTSIGASSEKNCDTNVHMQCTG